MIGNPDPAGPNQGGEWEYDPKTGQQVWHPYIRASGGYVPGGGWAVVGDSLSGRRTGFEELVHALPGGGFQVFPNSSLGGLGIPRMATGGVVPASASFGAFSGGQATSANSIRQLIREELGQSQNGGGDITVTMPVYLDSEKIYEGQKKVSRRIGTSLILGEA